MPKKKVLKTIVTFTSLVALIFGLTSCTGFDTEYLPDSYVEEEKWVCKEVDMYFYMASPYPYGELIVDGNSQSVILVFAIGGVQIDVYQDTEVVRSRTQERKDDRLFSFYHCKYRKGRFIAEVYPNQYIPGKGGPHELTFIREDY